MPPLIADGRVPLSAVDLLRLRIEATHDKTTWWDTHVSLGDAIAYHPSGKAKIVLDAGVLRSITARSALTHGMLTLEDGVYASLPGIELSQSKRGITDQNLSKRRILNHPFWNAIARMDSRLLEEYTDAVFSEAKARFAYEENMGVSFAGRPKAPCLQPIRLSPLIDWSWARGERLDSSSSRIVGVAPKR